ncbi:MAG: hypothetical protein KF861_20225 [Planctomycetaceae bacterium]|nr:hypothetical protein [Planctomycetaceae bacterium]
MIPTFHPEFGQQGETETVSVGRVDLIVVTQSCDLEARNGTKPKALFVALCPIFSLEQFETINPHFKKKGVWEDVRRGRREGLHMLAGPDDPQNNRNALVVDFRQIYSLPLEYLSNHASEIAPRWRLQSPFLEHFSQAFARFFMRVGLPSAIPPFK